MGEDGILRGLVFGEQAGPWQHAACLFGVEPLILATFDDPAWVHELLASLTENSIKYSAYVKLLSSKINTLKTIATQGRR